MKKWEGFVVGFLLLVVAAMFLVLWSVQNASANESTLWFVLWTVGILLAGVAFGMVPAMPILYQLEKKAKTVPMKAA